MREIKFRQPIIENGKFKGFHYWGILKQGIFVAPLSDARYHNTPSNQFTGLLDKNGKEIYQGDIVQVGEGEHITQIEIRYGTGTFDSEIYKFTGFFGVYLKIGFGGGFKPGALCEDMDEIIKDNMERFEVIGNIHKNPEMLEEKKGCGKMYCAIEGCGRVDETHTAHCIIHNRSLHKICGENGYCKDCKEEEKQQ